MSDLISEVTEKSVIEKLTDNEEEQCFSSKTDGLTAQFTSRLENLQKISEKKQTVLAFSQQKKLLKLAIYSKCQVCFSKKIGMVLKLNLKHILTVIGYLNC